MAAMRRCRFVAVLLAGAAMMMLSVLTMLSAPPAWAEQRVALVIGNGSYAHAPALANPLNDAADIGAALERLGFAVTRIENADRAELWDGLQKFSLAASASEVAVVFYAGHGIEVDRRNFLVPVDARLLSDRDVEFETVPLDLLSRAVEGARGLRLIVLDACRDNPFAAVMQRAGATRSIGRGLARVEPRGETLVAYAAKEGTVAADGAGRNSPYTEALLAHLEEPGLEVGLMFRKVRDAVVATTGGRQEPFVYGSLSSRGAFLAALPEPEPTPAPAPPTAEAQSPPAPAAGGSEALRALAEREHLFWESVKDSQTPDELQAYLDRYPEGAYAVLAHGRLKRMRAGSAGHEALAADDAATSARLEAARLEAERERLAAEREFWASVKDSRRPEELQAYLDIYPEGAYAVLARSRLDRLAGAQDDAESAPQSTAAVATAAQDDPSTPQPSVATAEAVEASLGLERAERRQIQLGLASLDHDPGPADGLFGRGTRGAIGGWQSSRGSEASGYLNAEAAKLLLAAGEEAARERAAMRPGKTFRDCATCPEMVVVPAGAFRMGSPRSEEGRDSDEGPQHRVTIPAPFAVGKYEVTFAEWDACVAAGGCNGHRPDDRGWGRGRRPVINVSWEDAKTYVGWLSRETGERYRLLSEAEWEYSARAGTTGPFHFGARISTDQANYDGNYSYGSGRKGVSRRKTMPVGSFPANAFGLHDVHGNLKEWVEDCWHSSYAGAPTNGSAWVTGGDCERRVLRGGSWYDLPRDLRSANRNWGTAGIRYVSFGFRVSRTLTP